MDQVFTSSDIGISKRIELTNQVFTYAIRASQRKIRENNSSSSQSDPEKTEVGTNTCQSNHKSKKRPPNYIVLICLGQVKAALKASKRRLRTIVVALIVNTPRGLVKKLYSEMILLVREKGHGAQKKSEAQPIERI
jgi:hypothetical protein